MSSAASPCIFGEVLFDVFPGGEQVLGGAPFNVAWHLQALGEAPQFISRVGDDPSGQVILKAMRDWGMNTAGVQHDPRRPTGRVVIEIVDAEPRYQIEPDSAYDFIAAEALPAKAAGADLLYHGTLALRNQTSREALEALLQRGHAAVFLDVNLRSPWWRQEELEACLQRACWVKLNREELRQLGFCNDDPERASAELQERFALEQVILTSGAQGALVRTLAGKIHRVVPEPAAAFFDAVGAGDAFTAVYLHGLLAGWSIPASLQAAQRFASRVVGLRGATTRDREFYRAFKKSLQ